MALGAQRVNIYFLVMREATWLAVVGVVMGTCCSLAASLLLRSMLFGVTSWDLRTIASVALVLAAAGLLASYVPSRRAALINPTEAPRAE
jgi:macrolide transport system ATP-binding/permease protein